MPEASGPIIEQTSTRVVYETAHMRLREDGIRRPDGSTGTYSYVEKPDFALIIPVEDGGFHLVEQYRYPVRMRCWEFPQGTLPGMAVAAGLAEGLGGGHAVVTLGAAGAVLAGPSGTAAVPGFRVTAVDTVGAGDAFVGALAVVLASGLDPADAVTAACAAGAAAATRRGAQAALPRPADVRAATGFSWPA